jgi:SMI1 / KNR4 family (SUKH-1)
MSMNEPNLAFEFIHEKKVIRRAPATDAQIAVVEARFGPLPADYKRFLQSVNGGAPAALKHGPAPDPTDDPRACVVVHPERYPFGLECFYGLGGEHYEVEDQSKWPSSDLGREVVAIAGDGAGDQLIFLASGDPAVYWWKHDERVPPIRMASSFTELLRLIRPLFAE